MAQKNMIETYFLIIKRLNINFWHALYVCSLLKSYGLKKIGFSLVKNQLRNKHVLRGICNLQALSYLLISVLKSVFIKFCEKNIQKKYIKWSIPDQDS